MKREELLSGLKKLYLNAVARDYYDTARECEKQNKTYEQYLACLVDNELRDKERLRNERLLKESKLPLVKLVEEFEFGGRTGVTLQQVTRLCDGEFVRSAGNVVFYGSFGVGKSHLAMAITRKLCEQNLRCLFTSTQALINDLVAAQKTLNIATLFKRLDRYDLLVLDELGYTPQNQEGADLFFQLISQRYERRSVMITTNLTYSEWEKVFLSPITTAAAVDRIIHNCETFNIQGPSWRAEAAKKRKNNRQTVKDELATV